MSHDIGSPLFVAGLFLGMLLLLETGRRLGLRRKALDPQEAGPGWGPSKARCSP